MASELEACKKKYEQDWLRQRHCCVIPHLDDKQKAANRAIFNKLCEFQEEINAKGSLPYSGYEEGRSKKSKDQHVVVKSSLTGEDVKINYPEGLCVPNPRLLKQILPIPDIHKVSDVDCIYRFLIARKFDINLAMSDLLNYISFREKYDLNNILWDAEVEAMFNGLDGEELLAQTIGAIAKKAGEKKANPANLDEMREKVNLKKLKVPRPLLQAGWAAWNCGVNKTGHVLFYQRPNPRDLADMEKRWRYQENAYDMRNPDFYSVTPPYSNLLVRLYLRHMEKGRRLSRLLNYNQQYILREGLKINVGAAAKEGGDPEAYADDGGGVDCLVDVGSIKMSHLTGSKCRDAIKLFVLLSVMAQFFFPENMKRMIIVNGGFIFKMIYKIIRPWLDPQTQRKIVLLSATNKAGVSELSTGGENSSPISKASAASEEESDDDDEGVPNDANYALLKSLNEYIDDTFIPSWYGGKLQCREAPLFYGDGVPKQYAESPYFPLAKEKLRASVLPELLTDKFLLDHAEEGMPVSEKEFTAFCELNKGMLFKK